MYKKWIWPILVLVSLALSIVFIISFGISINISSGKDLIKETGTDTSQEAVENDQQIDVLAQDVSKENLDDFNTISNPKILVIGDSIGFGFGDNDNEGIGNRYAKLIGNDLINNPVNNLSVSGDQVADLELVVNKEENQSVIKDMDLIIISIGGNDLNRISFKDTVDLEINYKTTLETYKESLTRIIKVIRDLNPQAQLAIVGLYDPYANNKQKTQLLLNWNYETRLLIQEDYKCIYIPTYEYFQYHLEDYLAFDEFHPSAKGYEVITDALYNILK